jgi:4-aminobutyrate aminotransferase
MGVHDSLHERHKAVMPSWLALYYDKPISLVRGDGRRVWDAEGGEYLDFFGGILTTISGYNVPEITEALREQASRMIHTSTLYLIEPAIELAELISRLSPIDGAKVFFACSGTEANDTALLLATGWRRSNQVLAMRNSYHGRSFSSVAITGNRGWSASSLSPVAVSYVDGGYYYRNRLNHLSDTEYIRAWAEDLRFLLETTTSGDVACFVAEPIQGVGGFTSPPDGFYGALEEVLDEFGILFVSDEVQTGWGRTGEHFWGIEAHGVTPDIITFAKGIGNGLSIGGVIARPDIMDSVPANSISTFGGNPLSTAGALANLRYLLDNDLQSNARKVGEHLMLRLRELAETEPSIGDVRGKGLMLGIEFVAPGTKKPAPGTAAKVIDECRARGLLVGKGGLYNSVIRFAPPLSVTLEEADEGFGRFARAVAAARTGSES